MKCRNKLCIYWNDKGCRLEDIIIDEQGRCLACAPVEIPDGVTELFHRYWISLLLGDDWPGKQK